MAERYGIASREELDAYVSHPLLRARLAEISHALLALPGSDPVAVLGSIDALKVRSSMTLFELTGTDPVFGAVLDKYYGRQPRRAHAEDCERDLGVIVRSRRAEDPALMHALVDRLDFCTTFSAMSHLSVYVFNVWVMALRRRSYISAPSAGGRAQFTEGPAPPHSSMRRMAGIAQVTQARRTIAAPAPTNHPGAPTASAKSDENTSPSGIAQDMMAP